MEADKAGSDEVLLFISRLPASFLNAQLLARLQTLRVCARAQVLYTCMCACKCVYTCVSCACQSVYVFARTRVYVCTSACVCVRALASTRVCAYNVGYVCLRACERASVTLILYFILYFPDFYHGRGKRLSEHHLSTRIFLRAGDIFLLVTGS